MRIRAGFASVVSERDPVIQRVLLAVLCGTIALHSLHAAGKGTPPSVAFGRSGVTVAGLKPGTRLAWLGMIREPRKHRSATRIVRGFAPATPGSSFSIDYENADTSRSLWVVADVDNGSAVQAKPAASIVSQHAIPIQAVAGKSAITVGSSAVEVLYVRPHGGAWTFSVADGGGRDGDRLQNGTIVVPLASLTALKGNPHPPSTVESGDLVLVLDPDLMRSAAVEVQP